MTVKANEARQKLFKDGAPGNLAESTLDLILALAHAASPNADVVTYLTSLVGNTPVVQRITADLNQVYEAKARGRA